MTNEIITIKEVAEYLKINERTVYRMAASSKIPAFKVGGSWRFRRDEIESWIKDNHNAEMNNLKNGQS